MRHLTRSLDPRGRLAAALITLALLLAGCGSQPSAPDVGRVVDESSRAAAAATRLSHRLVRRWCPHAAQHHGPALTQRQARRCLARAQRAWLTELHRHGYDPNQAGRP